MTARPKPRGLGGNIAKLYAFSFLKMALFPMAIITLFWKDHIGLSLTQILLLQGLFSLATLLMEYPSGYVSDRLGYRFALTLASLTGVAGWAVYTVARGFGGVLAAEALLGIAFAFISGSDTALLFETLRAEGKEELYARYDGRMNGFAQLGEAVGALFAGVMYATWPLLPFVVQVGVWLAAFALCRSLAEGSRDLAPPASSHLQEAIAIGRNALVDNRRLRNILLFATVLGVASFYPVWLIQPYMQQVHVPIAWFGPVWAGANLTVALGAWLSHRVHFALGDRGMAVLWIVLILAGYLGLGLTAGVWSFLFYYLLTAMRGLQGPILRHQIQRESRSAERASILSLKSFLFRLLFVATGPLIGRLADREGLAVAFLCLAAAFALALPPLARLFLRRQPLGDAL